MQLGLPPIAYEVGTEEVAGGLVDYDSFCDFIQGLRRELGARGLADGWPCFIVGKVGTDLHTSDFAPEDARRLFDIVSPLGSLIKGHYTDWVSNPAEYRPAEWAEPMWAPNSQPRSTWRWLTSARWKGTFAATDRVW